MGEQGKEFMDYKENYFANACRHEEDIMNFFRNNRDILPLKVELMDGKEEPLLHLQKIFENAGFSVFSSFITVLEIVDPDSNKGACIKRYLQLFDSVKSYGIGDGENDISIFDAVDVSVAVNSAKDLIKDYCDLVIKDCNNEGVGHFIFDTLIL